MVLNKTRITSIHLLCKTLLDYTVATLALLLLFTVLIYLIKRDSPGLVFAAGAWWASASAGSTPSSSAPCGSRATGC